ncbi:Cytoplasmic tRNA 2-thiolation protein 2 [Elasticomyces elasticus]|uniref:Cytoplasmic tRNA 2-thiolation protein 2 n=1 Tax=Elasticomyces elasticus TaxID=574655 RepID=A0AAN7WG40_9PEZI|nr:Cytoplasmic tRNA 2-thiolation protein 2 [Elasticomyces elasticus]
MPGRQRADVVVDRNLCRRCQVNEPTITVRTEPLCAACFGKYVSTKIVKRMESFRVRHAGAGNERLLLLPLSFGPCSMTLLHVLSQHLTVQAEKSGRTGYRLHVLHVDDGESEDAIALMDGVKQRYPEHVYSTCRLSDALDLEGINELLDANLQTSDALSIILGKLNSATSRDDMLQILLRKLVVDVAKQQNCEAIIWGDSTTRLAERTLAETAKGRGFTLPSLMGDGASPHGVPFYYPMRDLLSKEIVAFASQVGPSLDAIIRVDKAKPAVSTKNTTIDDLMRQYFESVEREYPSIVANVVRTTSKLQAISLQEVERQCELCDAPLQGHSPERSRLCYGCIRILPHAVK